MRTIPEARPNTRPGAKIWAAAPGKAANFDRLAPLYRWMEWFSFGPWLGVARRAFLAEVREARSALVLGDGDGRYTARLLRTVPGVRVMAVDSSAAMLDALLRRAGTEAGRVMAQQADARIWAGTVEGARGAPFDLIATHFFLDCLSTAEVVALAGRLRDFAAPGAVWVVSEFAVPPGWFGRWVARPLVAMLYAAFGVLTGLEVRRLPDHVSALGASGFVRTRTERFLGGLLVSEMWHLTAGKTVANG